MRVSNERGNREQRGAAFWHCKTEMGKIKQDDTIKEGKLKTEKLE